MKKLIAFLFIIVLMCAMVFTAFYLITQRGVFAGEVSLYAAGSNEPVTSGKLRFNESHPLIEALRSRDKLDAVPPRYTSEMILKVVYRLDITKYYPIYLNPYTGRGCIEKGLLAKAYYEIPGETLDLILSNGDIFISNDSGTASGIIGPELYKEFQNGLEYIGGEPGLSASVSEFKINVGSSALGAYQYTIIADHGSLAMYANTPEGYYAVSEKTTADLYSTDTVYSEYKDNVYPFPNIKLLSSIPIEYEKIDIRWTRLKPSGETESETIIEPSRAVNGLLEPGQEITAVYSTGMTPDGIILYEYRDGTLFAEHDMLTEKVTVPKFEGNLSYTLKAIYEKTSHPESYGTVSMDYSFSQTFPASSIMAYSEAKPGDILAFFIDYPDEGESFSIESELGNFKADFMPYGDSLIVYMPINWWTSPDEYTATVYKNTESGREVFEVYAVTVLPDDFVTDYQYLEVSDELKEKTDPAKTANDGVIVKEAKSNPNPTSYVEGTFIMPLAGELGTSYAMTRYINGQNPYRHSGLDIDGDTGDPIVACNNGVIVYAGPLVRPGNTLIIDHGMGLYTSYLHLSGFAVEAGDYVKKGDVVAYVGSTGFSTGPHLHWSVTLYGNYMSPLWLVENPIVPE
ncbi:MAG: M23 family metallopeptidase [Clostridia bacterium]|nr:M23 family metallopeptidase [Clostridia bacterium]